MFFGGSAMGMPRSSGGDPFSMFGGSAMGMPGRSSRMVFSSGMPGARSGFSSDDDDPMGMPFGNMNGMFPGMSSHQRSSRSQPSYVIPKDVPVKIHGLTGAPEHNGKCGTVAGWDASRSRYEVIVE